MKRSDISALLNGQVICDCGNLSFFVGMLIVGNNNHIQLLECDKCGHQLAVPFQTYADTGADMVVEGNA